MGKTCDRGTTGFDIAEFGPKAEKAVLVSRGLWLDNRVFGSLTFETEQVGVMWSVGDGGQGCLEGHMVGDETSVDKLRSGRAGR